MTRQSALATARTVFATAREARISFLAAGIAYYMLVSLVPLGVLGFVVATSLGGGAVAGRIVPALETVLSPSAAAVVEASLFDPAGRGGVTVAGLAVLLWGGLRVFRGLDVAFSLVYGTGDRASLGDQVRDALVALVGIAVAVAAVVLVTAVVAVAGVDLAGPLAPLALVGTFAVAFLPMYVVFPDAPVGVRAALPGTLAAAVGWTLLGSAFTVYAVLAGDAAVYGVLGGVLLLVTWFYAASLCLLLGAVLNAVVAGERRADRHLQQAAVRTNVTMTDEDDGETPPPGDPAESGDAASQAELTRLREELSEFRADVESRTLHRDAVEGDLRGYVRREVRRGHARGWGPYVVLLYGTLMTLGGFYYLSGLWAVLAMVVVWLSTLGLYVLMLVVGVGLNATALPARVLERIRNR